MTKQASYETYIFYLENGNSISKMFGLEDIVFPPYTKYCIRVTGGKMIPLIQNHVHCGQQYEILKEINILGTIRIGDFEVTSIGADDVVEKTKEIFTMIVLKNRRNGTKQYHNIYLDKIGNNILEEIVLILSKLDRLGSYEAYANSILLDHLQSENAILKRQISSIQAKLGEINEII
jgi:hypothetical protein